MAGHSVTSRTDAVQAFDMHEARSDGARVVGNLLTGLDTLLSLMLDRVAIEPGTKFGVDSMIMPTSFVKGHATASLAIDIFQTVHSFETAHKFHYLRTADDWYQQWLLAARLPEQCQEPAVIARLASYRARPLDTRRLSFETALERALPQAAQAPLVLYRLFPLAVEVATSLAFEAPADAAAARKRQRDLLPGMTDCHDCRGTLLEPGDECRQCGNPLWKFDWLTAE